ncbi:MAG: L-threonylcarbamoyladenylate synthase [Chitinophagales bacterium]|jgi:tRNA threonylcarbamoyl adenosine modification protein (Sua5/YciO/YrdC/YwlC family)|nr:L-threonylcarbamoyladenylate synthase [Chitinophagales bacterium]|tara:strand:+ start:2258 stop:2878 length:621 start_codon:yes stop_codon:yes gene_type:complete
MILRIDKDSPDERRIQQVVECLRMGGVIIYPTDTVYTLGCDISNKKAYEKVCALKDVRPNKANFSFVCYDLRHISEYTISLPTPTYKLMHRLLPGPYTFILNANKTIQRLFAYKKKEVGIRVPNHAIPRAIVQELGHPILSASIKNEDEILEYMTDPEEIYYEYKDIVDIVIDGGAGMNEPSTIINYTDKEPFLVRQGLGPIDIIN